MQPKKLNILLLTVILMISANMVYAEEFNYSINVSTLPFIMQQIVILNGQENISINLSYSQFLT